MKQLLPKKALPFYIEGLHDIMSSPYFIARDYCPACFSRRTQTLYTSEYAGPPLKDFIETYYKPHGNIEINCLRGATYVLVECLDCCLIYQKEVPNDELMAKLYEEWIDPFINSENHKKIDTIQHFEYFAHEIFRIVTWFNRIPSTIKVLDFGMGLAKWAYLAKACGCDVYGTELSKTKIKRAQECGIKVIDLQNTADIQFDFINVDQVLEHLREPADLLSNLKKYLKPEGLMKICVPDGEDIKKRLKDMNWNAPKHSRLSLHPIHPLEHINCFNRESLCRLVKNVGFEKINIRKSMRFPLLIKNNPFRERNPKHILGILKDEWRTNFNQYPTYLIVKKAAQ